MTQAFKPQVDCCTEYSFPRHDGHGLIVQHQLDDKAHHRLVINGHAYDVAGYAFIATAETPFGTFAGTTEYYQDSLPRCFEISSGIKVRK